MTRKKWDSILLSLLLLGTLASLSIAQDGAENSTLVSGSGEPGTEEQHEAEEGPCQVERERAFDSEVRIARFDFEKVRVPMIVTCFIVVVVLAKMIWHHKYLSRVSSNIPESCMLIVVGAHVGGIVLGAFYIDPCNRGLDPPFRFTPNLFFLFLLPPIVLESGYFLDNRAFFENLISILVHAVIGTIWNAFALGFTLYGLFQAGTLLVGLNVQFTISSALLFGTICAAVDPVAVLAVFDEIHVNKLLHILVFGESLLNDAVTIVLFQVLGAFANRPLDAVVNGADPTIGVNDVFLGIGQFVVVVVASVILGVLVGFIAALFTRFSEHVHVLEPIIILAMGYLSYILADMFEFSGIVSLIGCAIVMKHYAEVNISRKSQTTIKYSLKVLSSVTESIIFFFLGVSLYDTSVQNWDTGLVLWTLVFALIFRPIGVVVLTLFMNIFRVRKIGLKSMFVMSYSGLRGAVAFSLAISRIFNEPELQSSELEEVQNELVLRRSMLTAVTFLVLFTVFVQGTTIKPLVKRMKVRTVVKHKPTMNEAIHGTTIDHLMSGMEDILGHFGHNRLRERLQDFDTKYLRKIFERYPEAKDEQILHAFKRLQYKDSTIAAEKNLMLESPRERVGSHVSLHKEEEGQEVQNDVDQEHLAPEDCIPALNDILAASFAHPHEDHLGHMLARKDREHGADHRFEPVNVRKNLLQHRHARRRSRDQRHRRWAARVRGETPSVSSPKGIEEQSQGIEEQPVERNPEGIALQEMGEFERLRNLSKRVLLESVETDV